MMRAVSFVERLELGSPGNHSFHGLCLGDVDGDGLKELVIGSVDGVLAVFRGSTDTKPWMKCSCLGTITSVAVGDVMNQEKNLVVCSTAEGLCHIFDFHQPMPQGTKASSEDVSKTGIRPIHSQYLSLNIKTLLIASIDGRRCTDLFVGYTDRAVGAYRWNSNANSLIALTDRLPLNGQVGSLSVGLAAQRKEEQGQLLVSQAGGTCVSLVYSSSQAPQNGNETGAEAASELVSDGWSLKLTYVKGSIDGCIGVVQRRNPIVGTEVVGNIVPVPTLCEQPSLSPKMEKKGRKDECGEMLTALCTLDGSIKVLRGESKQWELQVDHSIFSLHTLDITTLNEKYTLAVITKGSGYSEIVGCAWDGMTYIVDQRRNVVKFNFGENVCAFCAGRYGFDGKNVSCLVYSTFHDQIYVYYNVMLPSIPSTNLLQRLNEKDFSASLGKEWDACTDSQKRARIRDCLYAQS